MVAMDASLAGLGEEVQANKSKGNSPLSLSGLALKEVAQLHARGKLADANLDCLEKQKGVRVIDDLPNFSSTASRDLKRLSISLSRYLQQNNNDWSAAYLSLSGPQNLELAKWVKICRASLPQTKVKQVDLLRGAVSRGFDESLLHPFFIPVLYNTNNFSVESLTIILKDKIQHALDNPNDTTMYNECTECFEILRKLIQKGKPFPNSKDIENTYREKFEKLLDRDITLANKWELFNEIMYHCSYTDTIYLINEFYESLVDYKLLAKEFYDNQYDYRLNPTLFYGRVVPGIIEKAGTVMGLEFEEIIRRLNEKQLRQAMLCFNNQIIFFEFLANKDEFSICPYILDTFILFKDCLGNLKAFCDYLSDDAKIFYLRLLAGEACKNNDVNGLRDLYFTFGKGLKLAIQDKQNRSDYVSLVEIAVQHENKDLLQTLLNLGVILPNGFYSNNIITEQTNSEILDLLCKVEFSEKVKEKLRNILTTKNQQKIAKEKQRRIKRLKRFCWNGLTLASFGIGSYLVIRGINSVGNVELSDIEKQKYGVGIGAGIGACIYSLHQIEPFHIGFSVFWKSLSDRIKS